VQIVNHTSFQITYITFQGSRNASNKSIEFLDFQSYLFLNTKVNWIPPEREANLLSRPTQSSERAQPKPNNYNYLFFKTIALYKWGKEIL
jgi:hypothetical protein